TIMAGVNQVIMLALSMVVIAGMIAAKGLGTLVYKGVSNLDVGNAFEGGLAVVIIAITLDRFTSTFAEPLRGKRDRGGQADETPAKNADQDDEDAGDETVASATA